MDVCDSAGDYRFGRFEPSWRTSAMVSRWRQPRDGHCAVPVMMAKPPRRCVVGQRKPAARRCDRRLNRTITAKVVALTKLLQNLESWMLRAWSNRAWAAARTPAIDANPIKENRMKQIAQVFELHQQSQRWLTAAEVADRTEVAPRTARHHCKQLAEEGILEV